jgi:glutamine amidotransferase
MSIALVDYGAGNLTSVRKALAAVGADVYTPAGPADLARARGVIVPGVGHFGSTRTLDQAWRHAILERLDHNRPLLGICVGLQWLFAGSTEAPDVPGFGVCQGMCDRLPDIEPASGARQKVPHVGWNTLALPRRSRLFAGIADGSHVYFRTARPRHRRHEHLRHRVHRRRRRGPGVRRAVPSREIGPGGPAGAA